MPRLSDTDKIAQASAVSDSDILYVVTNPTVAPISKSVTVTTVKEHGSGYAMISSYDNVVALSGLATGTGNWHTMDISAMTNAADFGTALNATANKANDKITITKTGIWFVSFSATFYDAHSNAGIFVKPYLDTTAIPALQASCKLGAGQASSLSAAGLVDVTTAGDDLTLKFSTAAASITITEVQLMCYRLGNT